MKVTHMTTRKFEKSLKLRPKFHSYIPGGAHTYAKGDDQFPEFLAPYIVRGKGCHVWDADGNEYIEYGMGLRSVGLGHAFDDVVRAAQKQMELGNNFVRPATIELECAEELLSIIRGAEMVKFAKNGSDVNSAAVKLARAYTGRDMIAVCGDHPFFAVDDWFIGSTPMAGGIPEVIRSLTVKFQYNNIASLDNLFRTHPNRIACVFLEVEKEEPPANQFLSNVQEVCKNNGAVFILDEMITGFRWHLGGGQAFYNIIPDLSTFGKAFSNGFSASALVGKHDIMKLGGLDHDKERVFLLSTTHGAEGHALAAAIATMRIYKSKDVISVLWSQGERLAKGLKKAIDDVGLDAHFKIFGRTCCLVYRTLDSNGQPSQEFRTLFLQESIKRGILAPSFVVSYSHSDGDIDKTVEIVHESLRIYRKALDEGIKKYLTGRPVKPVFRKFN